MNFKKNETTQKLRGGYYTPQDLADYATRWLSSIEPAVVLEPSCGDGAFVQAIGQSLNRPAVRAFEIDAQEAAKARVRASEAGLWDSDIHHGDFLEFAIPRLRERRTDFDAVVGNPPFIRYQYLPPEFQERSEEVFAILGCKFTKHTNAWVPFVLASLALLRPGGRLAMIIPSEIIHVAHAQPLRSYVGRECKRAVIVDPEELWFPGTLQGAVLLLAEKKRTPRVHGQGMAIHSVRGREFLRTDPEKLFRAAEPINGKTVSGKWTRALLPAHTRALLDDIENRSEISVFRDLADVDVGIVTGANKFFLVDDATVAEHGLETWSHPMFGRSEHCPGVLYDQKQHRQNAKKGNPTHFVWFPPDAALSADAKRYITLGEHEGLHERYKCRVRTPWYTVPSVYSTPVGMLKRAHNTPRLIRNKMQAYTTDTAYRIKPRAVTADELVYVFLNALTALSSELEGRHYGGGVLELVPSEIERLLIPMPRVSPCLRQLDEDVRSLDAEVVLAKQSAVVLGAIGVTPKDQVELLDGWRALKDRRHRTSADTN